MSYLIDKDIYDFEVGDLVRLSEDIKIEIGYGLVADVKLSFDDVYDLKVLDQRIKDRKSTRLNSSHVSESRMPSSA